jgi:hypothetical protein
MYFFYFDESGSRDPSTGTREHPKEHIYVLLAVGMFEGQWTPFDKEIANLKLELSDYLYQTKKTPQRLELAECEIKSNWIRNAKERAEKSVFLSALDDKDRESLMACFYGQLEKRHLILMASVIDKRYLHDYFDQEKLHKKAYEFLLERIERYLSEYHPRQKALVVMDDTSKKLNQAVTMKHSWFLRAGNQNLNFRHIVENPFFTRSELSHGVQLADLLAYNVYRAFREEDFNYPYFANLLPMFYHRKNGEMLDGLKVWPDNSPLIEKMRNAWNAQK